MRPFRHFFLSSPRAGHRASSGQRTRKSTSQLSLGRRTLQLEQLEDRTLLSVVGVKTLPACGFERSQGFSPGRLAVAPASDMGWAVDHFTNNAVATISSENPKTGSQALRLGPLTPTAYDGYDEVQVHSPQVGIPAVNKQVAVSMDVCLDGVGDFDVVVYGMITEGTDPKDSVSWWGEVASVELSLAEDPDSSGIHVNGNILNSVGKPVDGDYATLTGTIDFEAQKFRIVYNGQQVYNGAFNSRINPRYDDKVTEVDLVEFSAKAYNPDSFTVDLDGVGIQRPPAVSTVVKLTSSDSFAYIGEPWSLTASVTGSDGPATGSVIFKQGSKTLGTYPLVNGSATLDGNSLDLAPGKYTFTATYVASASALGSAIPIAAGQANSSTDKTTVLVDGIWVKTLTVSNNLPISEYGKSNYVWKKNWPRGQEAYPIAAEITKNATTPYVVVTPNWDSTFPPSKDPAQEQIKCNWKWVINEVDPEKGTPGQQVDEDGGEVAVKKGEIIKIQVDVPGKVGQYDLNLKFWFTDAQGNRIGMENEKETAIHVRLYATYGKYTDPKIADRDSRLPKEVWLKLATQFAAGLTEPQPILETLMHKLYAYADEQGWAYDYGSKAIRWKDLLDPNSGIKKGNCNDFSSCWDHCAKILGVSGTSTTLCDKFKAFQGTDASGDDAWGFVTQPSLRMPGAGISSERNKGNLLPWKSSTPVGYFFNSHVVGICGTTYYDALLDHSGPAVLKTLNKTSSRVLLPDEALWNVTSNTITTDNIFGFSYRTTAEGYVLCSTDTLTTGNLPIYKYLPGTSTQLGVSAKTSSVGDPVLLTATVKCLVAGVTPDDTITFFDGKKSLGTGSVTVTNGTMTATLVTRELPVGDHMLTAQYSGDEAKFVGQPIAPSTSEKVALFVKKAPTKSSAAAASLLTRADGGDVAVAVAQALKSAARSRTDLLARDAAIVQAMYD